MCIVLSVYVHVYINVCACVGLTAGTSCCRIMHTMSIHRLSLPHTFLCTFLSRPTIPLPGAKLTLQDCLEPNCSRFAQFSKLRTITTKMNSIKQTKKSIYPVRMGPILGGERLGSPKEEAAEAMEEELQGDVLWCTEMERLVITW